MMTLAHLLLANCHVFPLPCYHVRHSYW